MSGPVGHSGGSSVADTGALDDLEERLWTAPRGRVECGKGASAERLARSGLPPSLAALWARWDGISIASGWAVLLPLSEVEAREPLRIGDQEVRRVRVGSCDRLELDAVDDPWATGGELLCADDVAEHPPVPWASTLVAGVRAMLALSTVLYDDDNRIRKGVLDADGELTRATARRLLRRHLDTDEDAGAPRLWLARDLRSAGELFAAHRELRQVTRRCPAVVRAWIELAEVCDALGKDKEAAQARKRAIDPT